MLWDKAKFLCSTLNPSKKFIPLKPEKRAVRFFIRIYPQYWVSSIRGYILPTALFSHSCILFSRNFSAPLLFILTDKIKNPKPLISKKFGISVWCRWRGSNPHDVAINGFWVIQAIRNLMAWTGIKRSFPSLSKTSKTRKSLIKSAFSTQSTKSTSNSSPPRLSAARYPIWGAGGMLEGCKQDIPPANSYRGHTH